MRIRLTRVITILVVLLNIVALFFISKLIIGLRKDDVTEDIANRHKAKKEPQLSHAARKSDSQFIEESITIVIRSFEFFERDISETIASFLSLYPNLPVIIVSDSVPYPPLQLEKYVNNTKHLKMVNLQVDLANASPADKNPLSLIKSKYVLFVPDSTRISSKNLLRTMVSKLIRKPPHLVVIPFPSPSIVKCLKVNLNVREWYIQYETLPGSTCDAVEGKHVILVETETLRNLPEPFRLPFPSALYIQTASQNLKVKLIPDVTFTHGNPIFQSRQSQWKLEQVEKSRNEVMFKHFRLKKVIRETGAVEMYGCRREVQRCFDTVLNDMPDYLWEGRWTPPCCLDALRQTARHVFKQLEADGVRYWLEGGSLLGAMRSSDILPWDYDVDVGIYHEDISRCSWLEIARTRQVIDTKGYLWEKATEGEFFRVQFSVSNHMHVDLFPFWSRNGTMTKNTWFPTHKQDCEFPESFLKPIADIEFVGQTVAAPNNIRDFLELKFGKGSIENPQYPDPNRMTFSPKDIPPNINVENTDDYS